MKHPFPKGTRVRHYGQQYYEAYEKGTAVILDYKGPYGDKSYEYLVQRDNSILPGMSNEPTWWASYHTFRAESETD